METEFTPWVSLFGGSLIGVSALLLMLSLGRIMGATGILAGVVMPTSLSDWTWRVAVILGMMCGPWVFKLLTGATPVVDIPVSTLGITIGGFIVGVGVTLSSGCPSGHGICGLGRLSKRSIVAVLTFMASTIVTVYVVRHWVGAGT